MAAPFDITLEADAGFAGAEDDAGSVAVDDDEDDDDDDDDDEDEDEVSAEMTIENEGATDSDAGRVAVDSDEFFAVLEAGDCFSPAGAPAAGRFDGSATMYIRLAVRFDGLSERRDCTPTLDGI